MSIFKSCLAVLFPLLLIAISFNLALPELNGETKAAARAGDPVAQYEVARMYFEGIGVEQDPAQAIEWATKAANQGEPYAQFTLGLMYMRGQDVKQNDEKGLALVRSAAEQDHPQAQGVMAYIYGKGIGVKQDKAQFLYWVKRASKSGDPVSQFNLAIMHLTGNMVDKNIQEASDLLTKSADQGYIEAQVTLGELLMVGLLGKPDPIGACKWFAIAGTQGHGKANYLLSEITKTMPTKQMQKAARQANEWIDEHGGQ